MLDIFIFVREAHMGKKKVFRGYERAKILPAEKVFQALQKGTSSIGEAHKVSLGSLRVKTYSKGTCCVHCGREVSYFAIERQRRRSEGGQSWHLNAYHRTADGYEIMMTSDHIIPVSKGGKNSLDNRQVMCGPCNSRKSSFSSVEEGILQGQVPGIKKKIKKYEDKIQRHKVHFKALVDNEDIPDEVKVLLLLKTFSHGVYCNQRLWSYQRALADLHKEISCLNAR